MDEVETTEEAPTNAGQEEPDDDVTDEEIRQKTLDSFGLKPCVWQIAACRAQLRKKNVIVVAATGAGKTLPMWMPLIWEKESILLVISPLTVLSQQHQQSLERLGIKAIALTRLQCKEGIEKAAVAKTKRSIRVVIDEAHCLETWSVFREEYGNLRQIQNRLPERARWYITSATLPEPARDRITNLLRLRRSETESVIRSNDRPNIYYVVKPMQFTLKSKTDLTFVIPQTITPDMPPPPRFIIFCRTRREAEDSLEVLRKVLGPELGRRIRLLHAGLTQGYRERSVKMMNSGEAWGMIATVAAGMVWTNSESRYELLTRLDRVLICKGLCWQ
ncbi:P-loop containing nucleoside triphosphate hydrolase protein [Sistotremastrum suecicum HHB10207 ss-3]|uniref:DNA 3'-5' helicase n=1 Tax=Sistotremastrum suecicum HHB10207 ss-3 TaxID=1314776 RepID=A0A165X9G3_9AGAM|nr:P-loop containing nucleoside triphosphate hydrolase protein [Sistotremastrum suecicum HHB10207 ss-3]